MYQDPSRQRPNTGKRPQSINLPPKRRSRKRKKWYRSRRRIRQLFLFGCIVVALFSLVHLIHIVAQTKAVQQEHQDSLALVGITESPLPTSTSTFEIPASTAVQTVVVTNSPSPTQAATLIPWGYKPTMLEKYSQLYQENPDLIGWLNVNGLYRINFPVVQGSNNFYMNHDFNKRENVNGAAFLDETCKVWPKDDNLIIYAHNMKSGEMFGELNRLQSIKQIKENPFVEFGTLYEDSTYIPIAVYVCSVVQADDYFQFYVRNFKSETAFNKYIDRARELSSVRLPTDAQYGDELLTLVTCYDRANTQRLVVLLRKLRTNETRESVVSAYFE